MQTTLFEIKQELGTTSLTDEFITAKINEAFDLVILDGITENAGAFSRLHFYKTLDLIQTYQINQKTLSGSSSSSGSGEIQSIGVAGINLSFRDPSSSSSSSTSNKRIVSYQDKYLELLNKIKNWDSRIC